MTSKAKTSANLKRPRSSSRYLKAQVNLFKLDKGDVSMSESVCPAGDTPRAQNKLIDAPATGTAPPTAWQSDNRMGNAMPSFHGNFDLYAMGLPFLRSEFILDRDHAALLEVLRTHQAKPDSSAQIFLPAGFSLGLPAPGRLRSLPLEDPLEGTPHKLALASLALHDAVAFTARETTEDALYSTPPPGATRTPGVTATVALAQGHWGVSATEGTFKMRRAWASADGRDEVFEGFFSVCIEYSDAYRERVLDDWLDARVPFWGIRARLGPDGREIGLGTTVTGAGGDDDENLRLRELRLLLSGMAGRM